MIGRLGATAGPAVSLEFDYEVIHLEAHEGYQNVMMIRK
jgi:hypothetical protein